MTGLYMRRNCWWFRFTPYPGAAQSRVSLKTADEAEAIVRAREVQAKANGEMKQQMESCSNELALYLAYLKRQNLAPSTRDSRSYVLNSFLAAIPAVKTPKQFTQARIEEWFYRVRQDNVHTADAYLTIVHYWLAWLVDQRKLTVDVTTAIERPALPMRRRKVFLLPDQARKLVDACSKRHKLKFIVYCGLHAGLRKNEIIEARPEWFDLQAGLLHVQATPTFEPKDRDNRTIPLTTEFCTWLKTQYGLKKPFMLAPKVEHGSYRYRYDFRKLFDNVITECGLDCTFHDLRRTFASLHVSKGTSIYKVAKWLGDDVDVVQDTYGHLIPQDDQINDIWQ